MVSLTQYPYFSYDDLLNPLLEPLNSQTPINLLAFKRCFPDLQQVIITYSPSDVRVSEIYSKEMYRYGYFSNDPKDFQSGFHMWDYLNLGVSSNLSHFLRDEHGFAHGLTIIQQHGKYCDFFIFGSTPENSSINNFYLDKKEMLTKFIEDFYKKMGSIINSLSRYKLSLPMDVIRNIRPMARFSTRQLECGELLLQGMSSKQIARALSISPRTVDEYIGILRKKSKAKNRSQLIYFLNQNLK
jgi:DNA-binding CsgD family transcriptional regulator